MELKPMVDVSDAAPEAAPRPPSASSSSADSVIVGLRIRPLLSRDLAEGAQECLKKVHGEPQVVLGADRAFTYNHVFDPSDSQAAVYEGCMRPLVESVFEGYNATVLAYGQTGSGKTHTMGTASAVEAVNYTDEAGLIPRAIGELFGRIDANEDVSCVATASFIEIYKEDVHDLLGTLTEAGACPTLPIRETIEGGLTLTGLHSKPVAGVADAMAVLADGARNRQTGATAMNASSSRSHAIFTLSLELKVGGATPRTFKPKLHFVDLAGSERAKRTGASGERLQEGIQINKGLLALGNVINALCEKHNHVPYRDSKLTRLLQDSLGGNSKTMMLACVSPGDADLEETLNTLKYANRARSIRNKPILAQDPVQAKLAELQQTITALQARLTHYEGGGEKLPPIVMPTSLVPAVGGAAGGGAASDASSSSDGGKDKAGGGGGGAAGGGAADAVLLRRVTQLQRENETLKKRIASLLHGGGAAGSATMDEAAASGASSESAAAAASSVEEEPPEFAAEVMEAELEFQKKQGELSEQLEGLNASLALKEALLKQQGDADAEDDGEAAEDVAALCEALAELEARLKGVEGERDAFHRQVTELRMHSDETTGQPSKTASKKLETLELEIQRLRKQKSQQQALLNARQASEQRVKQLEGEIDSIKAQKLALNRRQREEAENHRAQRLAREREFKALQRKEERTAAQLSKLEGEHAKQAAVLKRKQEEVYAAQKKLKMQSDFSGGGGGGASSSSGAASSSAMRRPSVSMAFGSRASLAPNTARPSLAPNTARPSLAPTPRASISSSSASGSQSARDLSQPTASMSARIDTKRAEDLEKAAGVIGANPKVWLQKEIGAALEHKSVQEQLLVQVELRKAASLKLKTLEIRLEQQQQEGQQEADEESSMHAEMEALKVKVQHHATVVAGLNQRILKQQESSEAALAKLDAVTKVEHARALLKLTFPQLISKELELQRKDKLLEAQASDLKDQAALTDGMRLQHLREKKRCDDKVNAAERNLLKANEELSQVKGALEDAARAASSALPAPLPADPGAALDARLASVKTRVNERTGAAADDEPPQAEAPTPRRAFAASTSAKLAALKMQMGGGGKAAPAPAPAAVPVVTVDVTDGRTFGNVPLSKQAQSSSTEDDAEEEESEDDEEESDDGERWSDIDWEETSEGEEETKAKARKGKPAQRKAAAKADKAVADASAVAPVQGLFDDIDDEAVVEAGGGAQSARSEGGGSGVPSTGAAMELEEETEPPPSVRPQRSTARKDLKGADARKVAAKRKAMGDEVGVEMVAAPAPAAPSYPPPPPDKPASKRGKGTSTAKAESEGAAAPAPRPALAAVEGNAPPSPAANKGGGKRRLGMPTAAKDLDVDVS